MRPTVFNAGVPGDTTVELLKRFERDVAAHDPTLVILWIGVNDMLYPGHTLELTEFQKNYQQLLEKIRTAGAAVILCTLPPQIEPYLIAQFPAIAIHPVPPSARLDAANDWLRRRSEPLADLEAVVRTRPIAEVANSYLRNLSNSAVADGLHLTREGNEAVAARLRELILQNGLPANRIVCFGDSLTYGLGVPRSQTYPARLFA